MKTGSTCTRRGIRSLAPPPSTAALGDVFRFDELAWSRNPARNWGVVLLEKRRLQVIDVSTGSQVSPEFGPPAAEAEVVSLALSPDAEWLVTVTRSAQDEGYELRLWSAREGKAADVAPMRSSERLQIQDVSADGKKVLAIPDRGRDPTQLQLWEFGRHSYPRPYRELGRSRARSRSGLRNLGPEPPGVVLWRDWPRRRRIGGRRTPGPGRDRASRAPSAFGCGTLKPPRKLSYSIRSEGGLVAWSVSPDGRAIATVTADGVVTVRDLVLARAHCLCRCGACCWRAQGGSGWFPCGPSAITATLEGIQSHRRNANDQRARRS